MALIDAYTGPMRWGPNASNFYIHIHQENIGRANDGSNSNLAKIFTDQKQDAGAAALNYYKQLMMQTAMTPESKELLNTIFDQSENNLDLLKQFDEQFKKQISEVINTQALQQLLTTQKHLSMQNIGQDIAARGQPAIEAFNLLIDTLVECCSYIKGDAGKDLAILLTQNKHSTKGTRFLAVSTATNLNKALDNFIKNNTNETMTYDQKAAVHIAKKINSLARHLKYERKEAKKKPTESSINNIVNKIIFSQGFAEAVAGTINETVEKSMTNIEGDIVATSGGQIQLTDTKGNIIGWDEASTNSAGKADVKFKNFQLSLNGIGAIDKGSLTLEVGASVKNYITNGFPNESESSSSDLFGSGSGGTIKEALTAIFGDGNIRAFYVAYNILAHGSERPEETKALNDILLTRQMVRLFSSRAGKKDFAQVMIVNGEVISILDLLLLSQKFMGASKSMQESSSQQVMLSIPERKKIENTTGIDRYDRVKNINAAINKARIYAYIRAGKITKS